jgi:hypothetical protein
VEFMLVFNEPEGAPEPTSEDMIPMGKYAQELASANKLRRGFPLAAAADGATARVRDGKAFVIDGPFPETKEHVAGVWIVEAADRAEALEIAKRCPHTRPGCTTEVHAIAGRYVFDDSEKGQPFILVFHLEPGFVPDPAKGREMMEFGTALMHEGKHFETAHLGGPMPRARLEAKDGRILVTDGPFAETKDLVGGYSLIRADGRAEAIDIARRFPHAKWGPVEVREILFFDET